MRFDVIIIGAGPNGLALALALGGQAARTQARVLLVDARDLSVAPVDHDTRGSALTKATLAMFKALGVMDGLAGHLCEMRDVLVTDGEGPHHGRPALLSFVTDSTQSAAASIGENRHINASLLAALRNAPQVTLKDRAVISTIERTPGFVRVHFAEGNTEKADLLVGADGRNSFVRREAGVTVHSHDDGQVALTFSVSHELPHHQRAEEHFSPLGVFALLPLPGNRASIVWGTSSQEAERLMALDTVAFEDELNAQAGNHLGRLRVEGRKQAYPLVRQLAQQMTGDRLALVGDAAHSIHPLAGLGLNLGFKDAAALADCVQEALARGEDIGGSAVLERYERWRRFDVMSTIAAMEGMNALFANDWPLLQLLRRSALKAVDQLPPLKRTFMAEAAGQTGDLPRLMRGI
jgi:2-octaprenyl-6-methoxyphenol hydroxylase